VEYADLAPYGVTHAQLKDMLRREEELRLCEETQQRMLTEGDDSYVPIVEEIQAQVSREFGLDPELGTMLLRCAESFARSDAERAEIIGLSLYRRHNRCVDGDLAVGSPAPVLKQALHLPDEDLTPVHLFDHLRRTSVPQGLHQKGASSLPLVLFAGSWS
jgi:hypothetical protein